MQSFYGTQTPLHSTSFQVSSPYEDTAPQLPSIPPCQQVEVPSPEHVLDPALSVSGQNAADEIECPIVPHLSTPAYIARHSKQNPSWLPGLQVPKPNSVSLPIPSAQFSNVLRKELAGNTLNTNSNFLEQLFPRERLPFPVDEDLLRKLSKPIGTNAPIWDELNSSFCPALMDLREATVCEWLNNMGTIMGLVFGRQCERLWWAGGVPLVDSSILRHPDLTLLDRCHYDQVSQQDPPRTEWAFVKALVVVHQGPIAQLTDLVIGKSYLTFLCQPHRRFTVTLSFEDGHFSITVTDRAGQVRVNKIDLMGPSIKNGLLLLSILALLMFGSPEDVGLDPHFEIDSSNGQVIAIECGNRRFVVVERIHALQSLFGRGTQVWIVVHNGIKYIMKDSWVQEDRLHNEVGHLRRMKDYKELKDRVPTLICGGDVLINGVEDSTRRYRSVHCSHRIHRRIVTSPVGEPITSLKSKKEFIRVMITIVETHRYLYDRVKILHCDLSINNVLLNRRGNESDPIGLLIDYDYSIHADSEGASNQDLWHTAGSAANASDAVAKAEVPLDLSEGGVMLRVEKKRSETPRMGTPPYMAIEALLGSNPTYTHKPQHDLESILYIILYVCTFVRGPGLPLYKDDMSLPISSWFSNNCSIRELGFRKVGHLQCYDIALLPYFAPYWHDFAPFVEDLIITCFAFNTRRSNSLQYQQVLGILEKAYHAVEEQPGQVPQASSSTPEVIRVQRVKRSNAATHSRCRDSKKVKRTLLSH